MKVSVDIRRAGRRDPKAWFLLIAILGFFSYAVLASSPWGRQEVPIFKAVVCPLKYGTGVPCPFCGITSGTYRTLNGAYAGAWQANILSPPVTAALGLIAGYLILFRFVAGLEVRFAGPFPRRRTLWLLVFAAILVSWAVNLWRAW